MKKTELVFLRRRPDPCQIVGSVSPLGIHQCANILIKNAVRVLSFPLSLFSCHTHLILTKSQSLKYATLLHPLNNTYTYIYTCYKGVLILVVTQRPSSEVFICNPAIKPCSA